MCRLVDNPICQESGQRENQDYCTISKQSDPLYSTGPNNCARVPCSSDQVSSPNCKCAYPFTGTLFFRAPSFSNLNDPTIYTSLETPLMRSFQSIQLPVDSLSLSNPTRNLDNYLALNLDIFPTGTDRFNHTAISGIGFVLSNQTFKPPDDYGPYIFIGHSYNYFAGIGVFHIN